MAPNTWDAERRAVQRVERLSTGRVVLLDITDAASVDSPSIAIGVQHTARMSGGEQGEVAAAVRRMFRMDEDLSEFYALCERRGGRWLEMTKGLGRLLRSPTVFEDVVKTICTTNIQWGGTKHMVARLVSAYGEPYSGDPNLRSFPTPTAIAAAPPDAFAQTLRMGYRSEYVHVLAERLAAGELDLEALRDAAVPTLELKRKLLAIKGVGPYAAATLLMLLGRYDELAVDTAFRQLVTQKYFHGQQPSDDTARAVYVDWGKWKYLAFWFDIWKGLDAV